MYIFVNSKCGVEAAEAAEELSTPRVPSDEVADLEWPVDDKQPFLQHMHAPRSHMHMPGCPSFVRVSLCTSFQWCIWICVLETWGSATQLVGLGMVHTDFGSVLQWEWQAGPPSNAMLSPYLGINPLHIRRKREGDLLTTRTGFVWGALN